MADQKKVELARAALRDAEQMLVSREKAHSDTGKLVREAKKAVENAKTKLIEAMA